MTIPLREGRLDSLLIFCPPTADRDADDDDDDDDDDGDDGDGDGDDDDDYAMGNSSSGGSSSSRSSGNGKAVDAGLFEPCQGQFFFESMRPSMYEWNPVVMGQSKHLRDPRRRHRTRHAMVSAHETAFRQ